jgi:UDPglucose--hexose-1-phosphate uridylyltransferase
VAAESESLPSRLVYEHAGMLAYCPYASRWPYEIWLQPLDHQPQFDQLSSSTQLDVARALHAALSAVESCLPGVAYNWWLHTSPLIHPFDRSRYDHYHWHIEIMPRLTKMAGFEWGTGWTINSVDPAQAASALRAALGDVSEGVFTTGRPQESKPEA